MPKLLHRLLKKRKSVLHRWMLTYFLVLLIPLAVSGYSYFTSYRIIEQEVQTSNLTSLKLLSGTLDQQFETARYLSNQILMDQRFKSFLNVQNGESERRVYQTELMQSFAAYCQTTSVSDILVYVPELNYCVSAKTADTLDRLYNALYYSTKADISKQEWKQKLSAVGVLPLSSSPYLSYSNFNQHAIVYSISSAATLSHNSYAANIFISIRLDGMEDILNSNNISSLLVMDRNGCLIEGFGAPPPAVSLSPDASSQYQVVETESEKYICSYLSSASSGLVYAAVTPKHLYWSSKYHFTTIFVISISLACIVGVSLSLYLLYKNYDPLNRLLQNIADTGNTKPETANEFDLISQRFQEINWENTRIKNKNIKQHTYLEEAYLQTVLTGTNWETLDDDIGMLVEDRMEGKTLALIAVYALNREESLITGGKESQKISLAFLLDNVLDELLNSRFPHEKTSFQDTTVFVFTLAEVKPFEDQIVAALTEMRNFFAQNLSLRIEAVIGNYCMDSSELCDIYQQVKLIHAQNPLANSPGIIKASSNDRQNVENLPMDTYIEPLCEAIRHLLWNDARYISEALFETCYESGKPYIEIQFYIMAAVSRLQDIYAGISNCSRNPDLLNLMQEMTGCRNIEELKGTFLAILQLLCDHRSDGNPAAAEDIHLRVKHYVQQNYADPNLNLVQITVKNKYYAFGKENTIIVNFPLSIFH